MAEMAQASGVEQTEETLTTVIRSSVLCVDLDGTLLKTDTLYECLVKALRSRPTTLFWLPLWLVQGRYRLKQALTREVNGRIDLPSCPRRPEVERLIADAHAAGKRVELITAADQDLLGNLSSSNQAFHHVIGSSDGLNLKGESKARFLRERHPEGFAYVGDSAADLPVWRAASERFAVNLTSSVRRRAAREGLGLVEIARRKPVLPALLQSMRLHQWLKNLLVLVPLGLMGPRAAFPYIVTYLSGFLLFGLLTSGTYILNDILDIESDRKHPRKATRPIASGDLPMPLAALSAFGLIAGALAGAFYLSFPFAVTLLAYLALTLGYSFYLKRIPLVDVLAIASLFTLRIVAGMLLVGEPPSEWLLMFSIFFFFSLALDEARGRARGDGANRRQGAARPGLCHRGSYAFALLRRGERRRLARGFCLIRVFHGRAALSDLRHASIFVGGHGSVELLDHADVALDRARPHE